MRARLVQQVVQNRFGLRSQRNWEQEFEVALAKLGHRYNLHPQELVRSLGEQPGLLRELAGLLTIGETYFFRAREQIDFAVDHLQQLLLVSSKDEPVRVWSAGCASGEEPYSVAMELSERLGPLGARVRILACDISADAIQTARAGVYRRWSFRGVPETVIQRHFDPVDGGGYAIKSAFRERVEFSNLSVDEFAAGLGPESVAVVLFRNVALYLDEPMLERCHRVIAQTLRTGGFLIQASTDPVPAPGWLERYSRAASGTFRKRGSLPAPPPPVRSRPLPQRVTPLVSAPASAPVRRAAERRTVSYASELGSRGELERALALAQEALSANPEDTRAYLIRAQLHLATGATRTAIEDLRRALFISPGFRLARYWYMVALQVAGHAERALGQLHELQVQLAGQDDNELLEDGTTTVGEMRRALLTSNGFYD